MSRLPVLVARSRYAITVFLADDNLIVREGVKALPWPLPCSAIPISVTGNRPQRYGREVEAAEPVVYVVDLIAVD